MIIGRKKEMEALNKAFHSEVSEFVAVYGRRRVGKTFLVRETFGNSFTFYHTGLSNSPLRKQLANFQSSLSAYSKRHVRFPHTWLEAFDLLEDLIDKSQDKKKIVFIDEMPWMDTPKSGFVAALEHFWNGWASARNDILLIACGSATSWIMNKVIKNKGGLHNRVTMRIPLKPFTLHECEEYAKSKKLGFTRKQVMQCYMVMGGVPYYWSYLDRGMSLAQNIDNIFFDPEGQLHNEFDELYASLFNRPETYIRVIQTLSTKRMGLSRDEIVKSSKGVQNNGKLSQVLEDLESCGFIRKYASFGYTDKHAIYQLMDAYTLFYYRLINANRHNDPHFWSANQDSTVCYNWNGLAFERVCLEHVRQIKKALGVEGVVSNEYGWLSKGHKGKDGGGAQIDLLIDRNDDVIDLCELKFSKLSYSMTEEEYEKIQNRKNRFIAETGTTKAVHLVLVTASGVRRNSYLDDFQNIVTGDALFEE